MYLFNLCIQLLVLFFDLAVESVLDTISHKGIAMINILLDLFLFLSVFGATSIVSVEKSSAVSVEKNKQTSKSFVYCKTTAKVCVQIKMYIPQPTNEQSFHCIHDVYSTQPKHQLNSKQQLHPQATKTG